MGYGVSGGLRVFRGFFGGDCRSISGFQEG